uniref:Protein terminal ear1 n=2 Tax=Cajanus cajan TaxID=3821 RepID=A0A151TKR4_CAJCA|nr:Protein terminal ear1 [Cajanus cajan]
MGSLLDPTAEEFRPTNPNRPPQTPTFYYLAPPFTAIRYHAWLRHHHHHASLILPSPPGTAWLHYTAPPPHSQGTLLVSNLDSELDSVTLRETFQAFGPVKEIRHSSSKKDPILVEFLDMRDAAKALEHMNSKEIHGRQVVAEFSDGRATSSSLSMSKLGPQLVPRTEVSDDNKVNDVEVARGSLNLVKKQSKHYWRGKEAKKHEVRFLIKEDAARVESRTTVMIKNIPNKYSQKLLLDMLDKHCIHCNEKIANGSDQILSSYDFVYLPIDFNNKCNVGYGFVNMTSPEATLRLYKAFHLQPWELFNSRKICEVTYARVQGLEALKEHFKNSKFPYEMEQYMPVVFSPARDGKELTEPFPIIAQNSKQ